MTSIQEDMLVPAVIVSIVCLDSQHCCDVFYIKPNTKNPGGNAGRCAAAAAEFNQSKIQI